MKINKEYLKDKLIGLGFVLNDKTVTIHEEDIYVHNREIFLFIFFFWYLSIYLISTYELEIGKFIDQSIYLFL